MPIEPPPSPWVLPALDQVPPGAELVAVGADLSPGMLLAGYRRGLFPMPDRDLLGWWSPDPRAILPPALVHVGRSLRRALPRFEVTVDRAFAEVVDACADPRRPHGWITPPYRAGYLELHRLGWAHSVEVWAGSQLAGGLFGVEVGGLFAAESKFHRISNASKVAVVALADLLAADGDPARMIDVQWRTEHLASLGVIEVARPTYLALLAEALRLRGVLGPDAVPAAAESGPGSSAGAPSRIRWRRT